MKVMLVSSLGDATAHPPSIGIDCAIAAFETLAAAMSKMTVACMFGICSSALCKDDCKDDEASGKTEWRHEHADTELNSVPEWFEQKMLRNDTIFQAQTARANFCSFPIENIKGAQNETRSSSPRTCGFKPPADIFPTAERPDNRMQKRLMTKPWRSRRTKEHRVIPANDPNVPNTNSWGKRNEGHNKNPRNQKTARQIHHLMVASNRHT
jgi:hypothetical protein